MITLEEFMVAYIQKTFFRRKISSGDILQYLSPKHFRHPSLLFKPSEQSSSGPASDPTSDPTCNPISETSPYTECPTPPPSPLLNLHPPPRLHDGSDAATVESPLRRAASSRLQEHVEADPSSNQSDDEDCNKRDSGFEDKLDGSASPQPTTTTTDNAATTSSTTNSTAITTTTTSATSNITTSPTSTTTTSPISTTTTSPAFTTTTSSDYITPSSSDYTTTTAVPAPTTASSITDVPSRCTLVVEDVREADPIQVIDLSSIRIHDTCHQDASHPSTVLTGAGGEQLHHKPDVVHHNRERPRPNSPPQCDPNSCPTLAPVSSDERDVSRGDDNQFEEIRTDYVLEGEDGGPAEIITVEYLGRLLASAADCGEGGDADLETVDDLPQDLLDADDDDDLEGDEGPVVTLAYLDALMRRHSEATVREQQPDQVEDHGDVRVDKEKVAPATGSSTAPSHAPSHAPLQCDIDSGIWESARSGNSSVAHSPRGQDYQPGRVTPRLPCSEESDHVIFVRRDQPAFTSPRYTEPPPPLQRPLAPAVSMPSLAANSAPPTARRSTPFCAGGGGDADSLLPDDGDEDCRNATLPRAKPTRNHNVCPPSPAATTLSTATSCQTLSSGVGETAAEVAAEYGPKFSGRFAGRPDWMSRLSEHARDSPMCNLKIPGTHLSLAVECQMRGDLDFTSSRYELEDVLDRLPDGGVFHDVRTSVKSAWRRSMPTQALNLGQQLEAGVRYFDLKVCELRGNYYGEHGLYCDNLRQSLRGVKTFLERQTREVVLLSFRRLRHLSLTSKRKLLTCVFQIFGARVSKCCQSAGELTLNKLYAHYKQVVLIFDPEDANDLRNHIFSSLLWTTLLVEQDEDSSEKVAVSTSGLVRKLNYGLVKRRPASSCHRLHIANAFTWVNISAVCERTTDNAYSQEVHSSLRSARTIAVEDTLPALDTWISSISNLDRQSVNIVCLDFAGCSDFAAKVVDLNDFETA